MRRAAALMVALGIGLSAGCVSGASGRATSFFNPLRQLAPAAADDVVQLDVAVIERPPGDPYTNRDLWDLVDEQAVAFETKAVLADNGFRIGLIGGMPPAGLQALLTSERSCANPRRLRLRAGNGMPVALGPIWPQCKFELFDNSRSTSVELEQAECQLQVVPSLGDQGKTVLHFTPHIKHGSPTLAPRPTQDPSGTRRWDLQVQNPTEKYDKLSWEVTLAPNDYVVVGARLDRTDTLGQRFFLSEEMKPVQRLLVLRAFHAESAGKPPASVGKSPPLALQAGWSTARGTAP
jgi:hypothetical protein